MNTKKIYELLERAGINVNSVVNNAIAQTSAIVASQIPEIPFKSKLPLDKLISVRKEAFSQVVSQLDQITARAFKEALETARKKRQPLTTPT